MQPDALIHSPKSMRALPALLTLVLCLGAALGACAEPTSSSDAATTTAVSANTDDAAYQVVEFVAEDGMALSGRLYGTGTRGVLLSHMYPADQTSWDMMARRLADEGYMALTYDFRGYGLSGGVKDIAHLDRDVMAAFRYLRGAGATEIVLAGASMGGTASLVAAAELQNFSSVRVAGVATFSAPVEFQGLSAQAAVPDIQIAMMFVAAEGDVGAEGARQLQTLADDRGDLQILPGSDHGTDLFTGDQGEAAWRLLIDFVRLCMPVGG